MTNVNLRERNRLILLSFLVLGFIIASGFATPRRAAAAGVPTWHEFAPALGAAKQGPADGLRLNVATPALPVCRSAGKSNSCRGRDTLISDNLTWDSVGLLTTVGIEDTQPTQPPD